MDIALFQPDIPQNTGALIRTGACLGAPVHIIEPCGFPFSERALRRSGLDYLARATVIRHLDFAAFDDYRRERGRRLVLLTTRAGLFHHHLTYRKDDILLCGQESCGVPQWLQELVDERVRIPMQSGMRSLNVAIAASIVLGEALRQTDAFPQGDECPPDRCDGTVDKNNGDGVRHHG
ncbi:MAG: tRNA (cytidine(34)-2'-O)-methyltransferase [Rhodothalassiaceae bacterium]